MTLYQRYAKKMALGGNADDENKFGDASMAVAGIGTGLIEAFDQPNEFGNQSMAGTMGKSAFQMGAVGAQIGGPVGAAIGGGVGLVTGFLKSGKQAKEENSMRMRMRNNQLMNDRNMSNARIAGNPSLIDGYKNAQMFATGGQIVVNQPTIGVNTENDTIPTYLNYIKSIQNKNPAGASMALKHIQDVRGPQMATNMQFLGKTLGTSSINDIAKRSLHDTDPQMNLLYRTIRENPDIINSFEYATEMNHDLAKKANGGTIEAPLSKAYLQGGQAKSLSSGTTEIEGNSHEEGGVKIPELDAEVEAGETTSGNFVFSKELRFAQLHKPIAKAKGIIEKKPQSPERVNAMKLLNAQENKLALSQEYLKKTLGIA